MRFTVAGVAAILLGMGGLAELTAADRLERSVRRRFGGACRGRDALAELLGLVFHYDSREILGGWRVTRCCRVIGRGMFCGSLRCFCWREGALDSDRFKEIVTSLKENLDIRGGNCFIRFGWRWPAGLVGANWMRDFAFG